MDSSWIYSPVFKAKQEFIRLVKCLGKTLYITKQIGKVISGPSIFFCVIYVQNKLDRSKFPHSLSVCLVACILQHLAQQLINNAIIPGF